MVLDEEALEAMLRRGNEEEKAPPTELTDETDEFEVYERPSEPEAEAQPQAPAAPAPAPSGDQGFPTQEELFEELPGRHADEETEEPMAEAEGIIVEETQPEAERPPTAPTNAPTEPATEPPARRPEVFPPFQEAAPAAPAPTHAPSEVSAPAPTPSGGDGCRIGLVHCTFNHQITDRMVEAAEQAAYESGAEVTTTLQVSGVYDAPFAADLLARRDDVDAVVVVGAVVTGDTKHDELITHATAKTLQEVGLKHQVPVGLGITGPGQSWAEAEARIGNAAHAVHAAVAQWKLLQTA